MHACALHVAKLSLFSTHTRTCMYITATWSLNTGFIAIEKHVHAYGCSSRLLSWVTTAIKFHCLSTVVTYMHGPASMTILKGAVQRT